jgi:hypothetical protein
VLYFRARQLETDRKYNESLAMSLVMLRLARLFDAEPFLVARLAGNAVRGGAYQSISLTVCDGPISQESRQAFQKEMARQSNSEGYVFSLKSERVMAIDGFRQVPLATRLLSSLSSDRQQLLELFEELIKIADEPRYQVRRRLSAMEAQANQAGPLSKTITPALLAARESEDRLRALRRCALTLVALDQFLQNNPDADPVLDQLELSEVSKTDPYSGEKLRLKKAEKGWIVYSVGPDLVDNEGVLGFVPMTDSGMGPLRR